MSGAPAGAGTGADAGGRPMAMFPLSTVLMPGALLPLHVFEPRYRALVADCLAAEQPEFGVVLIARGSEVGGGDVRHDLGTVARVEQLSRADDGRYAMVARGTRRLRVRQWMADDPYPKASVVLLDEAPPPSPALRAAELSVARVEALMSELGRAPAPPVVDAADADSAEQELDPDHSGWGLCRRLPLGPLDRQRLLSVDDPGVRLDLLAEMADDVADDLHRLLAGG